MNFKDKYAATHPVCFSRSDLSLWQPRFNAGEQVVSEARLQIRYSRQGTNGFRKSCPLLLVYAEIKSATLRVGKGNYLLEQFIAAVWSNRPPGSPSVPSENGPLFSYLFSLLVVDRNVDFELNARSFGIAANHKLQV